MATNIIGRGMTGSSSLLDRLIQRSLIGGIYPESQEYHEKVREMLQKPVTVYAGFDATAKSLHVGNLATIMNLIHFHQEGHKVICVIGDATTRIGDPSGHIKDRRIIHDDEVNVNAESIEKIIRKIFHNYNTYFKGLIRDQKASHEFENPLILRNSSWYRDKNVIEFTSEVFRRVRVGGLLHKKSISERINSHHGMNLSEFCYQIFQAYDWLELRKLYDCRLQIGGADQGGNIYTGHDLIKKITGEKDAIGLLAPLITNKTGAKLGKSVSGSKNIWLDEEMTSPRQLYDFFHSTPDVDVERYLKVFSLYDEPKIEEIVSHHLKKPQDFWQCQKRIAKHVSMLVHGQDGLTQVLSPSDDPNNKYPS